jgi:hypothetical protein
MLILTAVNKVNVLAPNCFEGHRRVSLLRNPSGDAAGSVVANQCSISKCVGEHFMISLHSQHTGEATFQLFNRQSARTERTRLIEGRFNVRP